MSTVYMLNSVGEYCCLCCMCGARLTAMLMWGMDEVW